LKKITFILAAWGIFLLNCSAPGPIKLDDDPFACDWEQAGGGPDRAGRGQVAAAVEPELRWKKTLKTPLVIEPTAGSGILFAPTTTDRIQLVSLKSGGYIGRVSLRAPAAGPCCVYDSLLAVNESGRKLAVLNWVTCKRLWSVDLMGSEVEPLLNEGKLFWQDGSGMLRCFEITEGKRIWERRLDYLISAAPSASGGSLVLVSRDGGIECLSSESGNPVWSVDSLTRIRTSPVIFGGDLLYCTAEGRVGKIDMRDGSRVWEVDHDLAIMGALATDGEGVYIGTTDNKLLRLDFASGDIIWEIKGEGPFKAGGTIAGDLVVFAGLNRKAYFVDKRDGTIKYEYETKGMLSARPLVCSNRIYIAGEDRNLYCFRVNE